EVAGGWGGKDGQRGTPRSGRAPDIATGKGRFFDREGVFFSSNWGVFLQTGMFFFKEGWLFLQTGMGFFLTGARFVVNFSEPSFFSFPRKGGEPLDTIGHIVLNAHTYFTRIPRCAAAIFLNHAVTYARMHARIRAYALLLMR
ncbi:MAG: hypothetical protein K2L39_05260, partial [Muribaculaceae bacterium]|nr:hypothetical protein [Muribaculaceae bacterium]